MSSLDITIELLFQDCSTENSNPEKLLGLIIGRKLNFNEHVTNLYSKIKPVRKIKH